MQSIAEFWFADYGAKTVPHSICALCMCGCFIYIYTYIYMKSHLLKWSADLPLEDESQVCFCYHPGKGSKN